MVPRKLQPGQLMRIRLALPITDRLTDGGAEPVMPGQPIKHGKLQQQKTIASIIRYCQFVHTAAAAS